MVLENVMKGIPGGSLTEETSVKDDWVINTYYILEVETETKEAFKTFRRKLKDTYGILLARPKTEILSSKNGYLLFEEKYEVIKRKGVFIETPYVDDVKDFYSLEQAYVSGSVNAEDYDTYISILNDRDF